MEQITINEEVMQKIDALMDFIGFQIDQYYASIAITCSSYANQNKLINQDSLAIVGDHVIKMIITSTTYKSNPSILKKDLTKKYQSIETDKNLESIGLTNNIDSFILCNKSELQGKHKRATTIEAIVGAIYLSRGIRYARIFLKRIGLL